jgi:hypothetical protein
LMFGAYRANSCVTLVCFFKISPRSLRPNGSEAREQLASGPKKTNTKAEFHPLFFFFKQIPVTCCTKRPWRFTKLTTNREPTLNFGIFCSWTMF